jgi:hypothetical protein
VKTRHRLGSLLALALAPLPAAGQTTAIINVNVVDVRAGRVREAATVVIRDGRIAAIGPRDSVAVPATARTVDARGGFLIPGLADMHAHFRRPEELSVFLAYGVTLVQYLNASADLFEWRDASASGAVRGPEIHACAGAIHGLETTADADSVIANARVTGFECVKPYDDISAEAFAALTAQARRQGVRTVGHIPRNLTWRQVLASRPSAIAHAEEFLYSPIRSAADIDTIVSAMRGGAAALVTTLANYDLITRQIVELPELLQLPEIGYASPVDRRLWTASRNHYARDFRVDQVPNLRRRLDFQRRLVHRLDSAGARLLVGTDEGNLFVVPGVSVHDELEQLVLAGLSPASALRAATLAPAVFLGRDGELGVVEDGRRADLVLLYGNPLQDITSTRLIAGVMRRGMWYPRDTLRAMLGALRVRYAREERFLADVERLGVTGALARAAQAAYVPDEWALNELGYQFWRVQRDTASARVTFAANARLHPRSWIAHGSLGEWRESTGDLAGARASTRAALALRPRDRDLAALLARIDARLATVRKRGSP